MLSLNFPIACPERRDRSQDSTTALESSLADVRRGPNMGPARPLGCQSVSVHGLGGYPFLDWSRQFTDRAMKVATEDEARQVLLDEQVRVGGIPTIPPAARPSEPTRAGRSST
jgi:hypothetical protein